MGRDIALKAGMLPLEPASHPKLKALNRLSLPVYRLVRGEKLEGHNDTPERRGLRIVACSVDRFIEENMLQ